MTRRLARATVGGAPRIVDLLRAMPSHRPANVFAIAGDGNAQVYWNDTATPGARVVITASTGQTATATASPATVPGLTNGTPVTFTVAHVLGPASWASDPVTPTAGDPGVAYYVDPAGSDANPGTSPSAPIATLAAAIGKTLGPGDAVLLRRGATWSKESFGSPTQAGAPARPITLAAYGRGPAPLVHGGDTVTGWQPYSTQETRPELLVNAAMETFGTFGAQVVPLSWTGFVGSGGGSISKSTTVVDTGSSAAAKMTFGGGTNSIDQTVQCSGGVAYTWTSRIATDDAGAAAGVAIRIMIRAGNPGSYRYLLGDGTWTSTASYGFAHAPGARFTTKLIGFTPETSGPVLVQYRSMPGLYAGQSVYLDNASLKADSLLPSSPNTYRTPLSRASGSYPGMLYRNGVALRREVDKDRLPNNGWLYDGTWLYLRRDSGNPATDGAVYEIPTMLDGLTLVGRNDWIVRDLEWRLLNRHVAEARQSSARIVYAENIARQVGCQSFYTGAPGATNGVLTASGTTALTMRGNDLRRCHTDLFYAASCTDVSVIDNTGIIASGDAADCLQIDQGTGRTPVTNPDSTGVYVARNLFDQRTSPSPKGSIIVFANNGVIEDNVCYGGHFGISSPGLNLEVRRNMIYAVGIEDYVDWAAGIYSETNGVTSSGGRVHHNLVVGCANGINYPSNTRTDTKIANNTVVGCTRRGFESGATWSTSEFRNNLLYNPAAELGETGDLTGLTVSNNSLGVDPGFVGVADFRPPSGSPLIDAGAVIAGITDGYLGAAPDIGCFEAA